MFCTKCGKEVLNEAAFCQYCGNKITYQPRQQEIYGEDSFEVSDEEYLENSDYQDDSGADYYDEEEPENNWLTYEELDQKLRNNEIGNGVMTLKTRILILVLYPVIAFILSLILPIKLFTFLTILVSAISIIKFHTKYLDAVYDVRWYSGPEGYCPYKRFYFIAIVFGLLAIKRAFSFNSLRTNRLFLALSSEGIRS